MEFLQKSFNRKKKQSHERGGQDMAEATSDTGSDDSLFDYLRAGYSWIHVRTTEDYRATSKIREALIQLESKYSDSVAYGEWRPTGVLNYVSSASLWADEEFESENIDIIQALDRMTVTNESETGARVTVFFNVRSFLNNPAVIQKLKDTVWKCRTLGSHVIFVGSHIDYPPELASFVTVYDFDLPNQERFFEMFGKLADHYEQALVEKSTSGKLRQAASAAVGMTELQGENALGLSIIKKQRVDPAIILTEKEQAIRQSDILEFINLKYNLDSLGGFDGLKEWLYKRKDSYSEQAKAYGLTTPKGILLCGLAGTGKSLASQVSASYFELPLIKLDMGRVFKSLVGASESAIRQALKTVEAVSPVVLWIEELEKSMAGTNSSGSSDSGTTARVMGTVLSWMQENDKPIFTVATANNVEALPVELLRKGRFSEIWGVIEPTFEERKEIWGIHICKVREDVSAYNLDRLAATSEGYTGAEIETALQDAMFNAFADNQREFTTDDMIEAVQEIIPQSITHADKINYTRKWMKGRVRMVSGYEPKKLACNAKGFRKVRTDAYVPEISAN